MSLLTRWLPHLQQIPLSQSNSDVEWNKKYHGQYLPSLNKFSSFQSNNVTSEIVEVADASIATETTSDENECKEVSLNSASRE